MWETTEGYCELISGCQISQLKLSQFLQVAVIDNTKSAEAQREKVNNLVEVITDWFTIKKIYTRRERERERDTIVPDISKPSVIPWSIKTGNIYQVSPN